MDTTELAQRLKAFCRAHTADRGANVGEITALPGHAGFSWSFRLDFRESCHYVTEDLVLRLPPPGVRWVGTADVVRQARVMQALAGSGVPVPRVRWAGDDLQWFERPYSIVERLPGDTLRLMPALTDTPTTLDAAALRLVAEQVTAALAALHRVEWQPLVADWGPPPSLEEEVRRWDWLHERTADPALTAAAPRVRERLLATVPPPGRTGLYHGDYQWSNHLLKGDRLLAVLDWELAGVGETLMDLGWLALFSDNDSWASRCRWDAPLPAPDEIVALYESAAVVKASGIEWFRALAGYKFALITGLNLALHRRGKRPDPHWEEIGPSAPRLLERALELLG